MPYITIESIKSRIPNSTLIEALDDDGDGVIDVDVVAALLIDTDDSVNAILGQRFSVPFPSPVPAVVIDAARTFCLELVYLRRGYHTDEENPWALKARRMREKLTKIASSDEPLTPTTKGKGSVKIISEPSRTQSSGGYLAT